VWLYIIIKLDIKGGFTMCLFKKWREKRKAQQVSQVTSKEEVKVEAVQPVIVSKETEQEIAKEPVHVEKPKEKPAAKPLKTEDELKEVKDDKQPKPAKYHVSQNKDTNSDSFKKWRVRKEGSTKTIKYFDTQKEAIAFAEELADKAGSSLVIHKVDGSIRKQDYTKK
jgi:uncharacterized protein YdaT